MGDPPVGKLADVRPEPLFAEVARGGPCAEADDVGPAQGRGIGGRSVGAADTGCCRGVGGASVVVIAESGGVGVERSLARRRRAGRRLRLLLGLLLLLLLLGIPRRHQHLERLAVLRVDARVRDEPRQKVDAVDRRVAGEGLGELDDVLDLAVFLKFFEVFF